jgi:hypothetical protein
MQANVGLLLLETPRQKGPRSNARRTTAIGMLKARRAQENIEVDIAALATIKALPEWHPYREQQSKPSEDRCLWKEPKGLTRN